MKKQKYVGKNIREVRNEQGISQTTLADKCGFSNTTLSAYENGKKTPNLDTTALIAEKLGVSIERLYYGDDSKSFLNRAPDVGKKIANSLYYLWSNRVIWYDSAIYNNMVSTKMDLVEHSGPVIRLLSRLNDFKGKEDTFPDPEAYIEMLLSSVASEINKEITEKQS